MKAISVRFLIGFIILGLVSGFLGEIVYAKEQQDCSCCTTNKCHSTAKCQDTSRACICGHQATKVSLPEIDTLPVFVFKSYVTDNPDSTYRYLSTKDAFHPPKNY
ncbi:MAG: hypothetical protein WC417_07850 [Candidatus Omnitrophota bacterium]|jgi:hypothetical protein